MALQNDAALAIRISLENAFAKSGFRERKRAARCSTHALTCCCNPFPKSPDIFFIYGSGHAGQGKVVLYRRLHSHGQGNPAPRAQSSYGRRAMRAEARALCVREGVHHACSGACTHVLQGTHGTSIFRTPGTFALPRLSLLLQKRSGNCKERKICSIFAG